MPRPSLAVLHNLATQLRIDSVRSTSEAGSGHPTTCLSAAEIIAALFFAEMRFDPHDPQHPEADRFVLSKGHARADSLRGLGRGRRVSARRGAEAAQDRRRISRAIRRRGCRSSTSPPDRSARGSRPASASRSTRAASSPTTAPTCCSATARRAEGSVWEAAEVAAFHKLDNLCAITDVNGLGQSRADAVGPRPRRVRVALARVRLARHRDRRPRHGRRSSARSPRRARPRASRR